MTNRNEYILRFRELIFQSLSGLIDNDYIYLDLSYHPNVGDALIWRGTETFLASLPYKCLYKASIFTCNYPKISKDVIVVLQGGGNFGDIWRDFQEFRLKVIEHYQENRIVVLPQSVYYSHLRLARKDAALMRMHKKLTICARDRLSYIFLRTFRFATNVIMLPDMAFCIDSIDTNVECEAADTLLMVRKDAELNASALSMLTRPLDSVVQDWISIEMPDVIEKTFYTVKEQLDKASIDELAQAVYLPHIVKRGVEQLRPYRSVYTTRLHGCILSILTNKKEVVLIDNSYGKNKAFYDTWLQDVKGVSFVGKRRKINIHRICQLAKHLFLSLMGK